MTATFFDKNNSWLFKIFFFLVCLSLLVPLVNFKDLLFPFVTSKAFLFRIAIELALPFYIFFLFTEKQFRPKITNPLTASLLAFFCLSLVSMLVGVNAHRSFWGNLERMGGIYYLAHLLLLYFYLLLISKKDPFYFTRFLKFLVWVAVGVSINGIFGKLGWVTLSPDMSLPSRVSSTLGNPIFLASYLVLPLGFALYFAITSKILRSRYWYYTASFLILTVIFLTGTRGAFLGLLAGLFLGLILYLFNANWDIKKRIGALGLVVIVAVTAGGLAVQNFSSGGFGSGRLFNFSDSNAKARLVQWQAALQGFLDRPFLGIGSENYYFVANKYYNPQQHSFDKSWFDKPHNYFLEILVTGGVLGLLAFLFFIGTAFWALIAAYKKNFLSLGGAAVFVFAWAAYQVQNFFVFDTVSASISSFVFLAFTAYFLESRENVEKQPNKAKLVSVKPGVVFYSGLAAVFYLIYLTNILPMVLAKNINFGLTAYTSKTGSDFKLSFDFFKKAIAMDLNYDNSELFLKFSSMALSISQTQEPQSLQLVKDIQTAAIDFGKKTAEQNPTNPVNWYYLAALRYFQSVTLGQKLDLAALSDLERAGFLAPNRPEIYYLNIQFKVAINELEQALVLAEEYNKIYPNYSQSAWQVAWVNYRLNRLEEAYTYASKALDLGYKLETLNEFQLLIDYHTQRNNFGEAIKLYEEAITAQPNNKNTYLGLVRAYGLNGQLLEARQLAEEIIAVDPTLREDLAKWLKK